MSSAPPPDSDPAPRRVPPRPPRPPATRPIDITYKPYEEPSLVQASRNSIYHVRKALVSPRVLAAVAAIGGWAWAGAQYVAGSARQSDLDTAVLRLDALQKDLAATKVESSTALTGAQQCVAQQGAAALAMKALVGQIARQRGRSETQRHNEQVAAESRYMLAVSEGRPQHEAVRAALMGE